MLQGPICNVSNVWGVNCNFYKLRDQIELLSSSTSNLEFPQMTYCYINISNSNSPFKQIITQNHHLYLKSSKINYITNYPQQSTHNIQINLSINPKQNIQNTNIQQNRNLKLKKEAHLCISKPKSYLYTYFL